MMALRFLMVAFVTFGAGIGIKNGFAADCPPMSDLDGLPQDQFVSYLTDPCRYDKLVRPNTSTPFNVEVKMDVTHLESAQSQFTAYLTIRYTYRDDRLAYEVISPKRSSIFGDESLKEKIWTPNLLMKDQNETTVVSIQQKDDLISIDKTGSVTYSQKMVATFYCWMNLRKFPFDSQQCRLAFSDWSYNNNNLHLIWTKDTNALSIAKNLHLTEFVLDEAEFSTGNNGGPYQSTELSSIVGEFSELTILFKFHRDVGYYWLDFFLPSYLLVFTAWVTFWLQADAGPPRATLGASTVVAFITLHLGLNKDIPKVSYVKANDIWFLAISCFIFFSLAEFAFVNVIWRRRKQVELKKSSSKYILKSAVMPRKAREDLRRYESTQTLAVIGQSSDSLNSAKSVPNENYKAFNLNGLGNGHSTISMPEDAGPQFSWTTMSPQDVAIFVDRKARIVFPIIFLIFNICFWVYVYCL